MNPVVVAHGLWLPGWETIVLRRRLQGAGFTPRLFRYQTVGRGLKANAALLADFIADIPGDTLDLVGYSLGGVVALQMLNDHGMERAGRVVCMGSPLNGSRTGEALASLPGGRRALGRSMGDLAERSGIGHWTGQRELGVIAGNLPVGLGRLLGAVASPNDGIVAVHETKIEGATDHCVLHVSHTSMLFDRTAADQAAHFLRNGRFNRHERTREPE